MRVGADIDNRCSKCGVMIHVVVAVVDGKIAKVECKQCGSRHRHRPVGGVASTVRSTRKASPRRKAAAAAGPSVEPDLSRAVRPYRATETYAVGDRVDHRTFGTGVVETVMGPTKVQVYFAEGPKTLVHGRAS